MEWTGKYENVKSPIWKRGSNQPTIIGEEKPEIAKPFSSLARSAVSDLRADKFQGKFPMMSAEAAVDAAQAAKHAYNDGRGVWPRLPVKTRTRQSLG